MASPRHALAAALVLLLSVGAALRTASARNYQMLKSDFTPKPCTKLYGVTPNVAGIVTDVQDRNWKNRVSWSFLASSLALPPTSQAIISTTGDPCDVLATVTTVLPMTGVWSRTVYKRRMAWRMSGSAQTEALVQAMRNAQVKDVNGDKARLFAAVYLNATTLYAKL